MNEARSPLQSALCILIFLCSISASSTLAQSQTEKPEWCKPLPRPEYAQLKRLLPEEPWFEVYKVAPGTFAIYEPHQSEEVISYLIVGQKQAMLFDTGMGIGNIKRIVSRLTSLPVVVLNSHTHDDHVGGNWLTGPSPGTFPSSSTTDSKSSSAAAPWK